MVFPPRFPRRQHPHTGLALFGALGLLVCGGCHRAEPPLAAMRPPEVVVATPVQSEVTEYEEFTGRTESPLSVEIRARVTGYLDKVYFKDGADVTQGEALFEIDPRTYQAELARTKALVEQSKARVQRLNADYERAMRLVEQKAISQSEADRVTYDRAEAVAAVDSAVASQSQAELSLSFAHITAPLSGRISRRLVDPGNLVKADETPLTTIVSLQPLYAYFDIDERTLLRLRRLISEGKIVSARESDVHVEIGLADEVGFSIPGVINFVDNKVEAGTGTLRARAVIDNSKQLLSPGLFIRIRVPIGAPHLALMIPEEAIGSDQGQKFVYTLDKNDQVTYRPIKVGLLRDRLRVVESGIQETDRVITSGQQRVRPGVKVQPFAASQDKDAVAKAAPGEPASAPTAVGSGGAAPPNKTTFAP